MQRIDFRPVGPLRRVRWADDETGACRTAWFASEARLHEFMRRCADVMLNDEPVHPLFDNRPIRWVLPVAFLAGIAVWVAIFWTVAP